MEERLNYILENFVHHGGFLENARLSFYQKIQNAKSMSIKEENNSVWKIIESFNSLRNDIAHRLDINKREEKIKSLAKLYWVQVELDPEKDDWMNKDTNTLLAGIIAYLIGFLTGFENEIDRFRSLFDLLVKSEKGLSESSSNNKTT
ncbi:hypothetical protein [Adhaeribacter aquaticus]|uniref:hypothetical protein n=1 Tax=Adhaeribacter aquaticus TaxID=299567 RepID=UPI0012FCBFEC|nr:hypothetical protein [Adhaeribacter aquaticus]